MARRLRNSRPKFANSIPCLDHRREIEAARARDTEATATGKAHGATGRGRYADFRPSRRRRRSGNPHWCVAATPSAPETQSSLLPQASPPVPTISTTQATPEGISYMTTAANRNSGSHPSNDLSRPRIAPARAGVSEVPAPPRPQFTPSPVVHRTGPTYREDYSPLVNYATH